MENERKLTEWNYLKKKKKRERRERERKENQTWKSQFPRAASFFCGGGVMVEVSSRGNPEELGHGLWASPMGVPPWEHSVRDGGSPAIVQGKWKAIWASRPSHGWPSHACWSVRAGPAARGQHCSSLTFPSRPDCMQALSWGVGSRARSSGPFAF